MWLSLNAPLHQAVDHRQNYEPDFLDQLCSKLRRHSTDLGHDEQTHIPYRQNVRWGKRPRQVWFLACTPRLAAHQVTTHRPAAFEPVKS